MAKEVRADPVELAQLAGEFLEGSQDLGRAVQSAQGSFPPPAAAFGNTTGAASTYESSESATEATGRTFERLVAVLEDDVDRIYQVAFAYQKQDEDNARRLCRTRRDLC